MKMYVPVVVGFCVVVFRFSPKIRIDEAIMRTRTTATAMFLRRCDFRGGSCDSGGIVVTGTPHDMQNLASGVISLLHFGQKSMAEH